MNFSGFVFEKFTWEVFIGGGVFVGKVFVGEVFVGACVCWGGVCWETACWYQGGINSMRGKDWSLFSAWKCLHIHRSLIPECVLIGNVSLSRCQDALIVLRWWRPYKPLPANCKGI